MKELSIKKKAKRYDEALERARIWKEKSGMPKDKQGILDNIFPELKESEDERIRKVLVDMFKGYNIQKVGGFTDKEIIAWLEKQGSEENKGNLGGISPNSAWSEEDERNIQVIDSVLFYDKSLPEDTCMRLRNWLESLKQRLRE